MAKYPPTQGFGEAGMVVPLTGYCHRFLDGRVKKVKLTNTGAANLVVGINATVTGATVNGTPVDDAGHTELMVETITAAAARIKGFLLKPGDSVELTAGDQQTMSANIHSVWALAEAGKVGSFSGGVLDY